MHFKSFSNAVHAPKCHANVGALEEAANPPFNAVAEYQASSIEVFLEVISGSGGNFDNLI